MRTGGGDNWTKSTFLGDGILLSPRTSGEDAARAGSGLWPTRPDRSCEVALCEPIDRAWFTGHWKVVLSFAKAAIGYSQRKEMLGSMREARRAGI